MIAITETNLSKLLNEHEVARIIGMSVASIRRWRQLKTGPPYLKVSVSSVRYRPEDLAEWISSRASGGGADAA